MNFFSEYFNSGSIKQQNMKRLGALLVCITAALLAVALIVLVIASIAHAIGNRNPSPDNDPDDTGANAGIPTNYTTTVLDATQLTTGNLLLIDNSHTYTGTPETYLFDTHETRAKTSDGSIIYSIGGRYDLGATEETIIAFNRMIADFYADEEAGGDDCLYISAAYNKNAANQVSEVYKSGTVIALKYYVDYNNDPTDIQTIAGVEKYEWIYDHAYEYGFIQITNDAGDENIFRYVGIPHATYMKNNNKTLAEYLELLQSRSASRPLSISAKNEEGETVSYNVYYQASSADGTAIVPSKWEYSVSGDNMGGYIITVDRSAVVSNKKQ